MLHLVGHAGKLYGGNGYWEDNELSPPYAQVLRLDKPGGTWQVDLETELTARMETLKEITFRTDSAGKALESPASLLVAGAWQLSAKSLVGVNEIADVYVRDDAKGTWCKTSIVEKPIDKGNIGWEMSMRSLQVHRDAKTGVDMAFLSIGMQGIFAGVYDASAPCKIRWSADPDGDSQKGGLTRPMAMTEFEGRLVFAAGRYIYAREDGTSAKYSVLVDMGSDPKQTNGGVRGLTAIQGPQGQTSLLWSWVENGSSKGCIFRYDAETKKTTREACAADLAAKYLGVGVSYTISMYNQALPVQEANGATAHLIGIEAHTNSCSKVPCVESGFRGGYYAGALFAVRHADGSYSMNEVGGRRGRTQTEPALVAPRTYVQSPFPADEAVYFGGFDCNDQKNHNTAWAVRGTMDVVLGSEALNATLVV
jgi:hypothetical protein